MIKTDKKTKVIGFKKGRIKNGRERQNYTTA